MPQYEKCAQSQYKNTRSRTTKAHAMASRVFVINSSTEFVVVRIPSKAESTDYWPGPSFETAR